MPTIQKRRTSKKLNNNFRAIANLHPMYSLFQIPLCHMMWSYMVLPFLSMISQSRSSSFRLVISFCHVPSSSHSLALSSSMPT